MDQGILFRIASHGGRGLTAALVGLSLDDCGAMRLVTAPHTGWILQGGVFQSIHAGINVMCLIHGQANMQASSRKRSYK